MVEGGPFSEGRHFKSSRMDLFKLALIRKYHIVPVSLRNLAFQYFPLFPWDYVNRPVSDGGGVKLPKAVLFNKVRFAENVKTPKWILEALCYEKGTEFSNSYCLIVLANNPSVPAAGLDFLSRSINSHVRVGVAGNPSTSVEVLKKLSDDDKYRVLDEVVRNPNLPEEFQTMAALKRLGM